MGWRWLPVEGGDGRSEIGQARRWGTGEVFVDCAEKAGLPDFAFSRQGAQLALAGAKDAPQRKCALRRIKSWQLDVYYLKTGIHNGNSG
jgi:hypothetical protein